MVKKKQINKRENTKIISCIPRLIHKLLRLNYLLGPLSQHCCHPLCVVQHCYCAPHAIFECGSVHIKINELNSASNKKKSQRK